MKSMGSLSKQTLKDKSKRSGSLNKIIVVLTTILLTAVMTGSAVYYWQKVINEREIYSLIQKISLLENQISTLEGKKETTLPEVEPTPSPESVVNSFTYNNFTISYSNEWKFLVMSKDENFPLKTRLSPLYGTEKVIALNKDDLYLIVTIETESEGEAGGIFLSEEQYEKFISEKDKVVIENSVFYLGKTHQSISSLSESDTGPYMWSLLAEYIPTKTIPQTGETYKGYEYIIKRGDYSYNFIITSTKGGTTELQEELINILETINW